MSGRDPSLEQKRIDMLTAVGHCITSWSSVEINLICIFRDVSGTDGLADALLTEPRGFSTRLSMIDQAVQFRLAKTSHLDDWQLLCKHASGLSSLRNQVAHATMLNYNNACVLQPYFGSTAAQPYLSIDDVKSRVLQFHELASCLDWFHSTVIAPLPSPLHLGPEPDLLARLRSRRA